MAKIIEVQQANTFWWIGREVFCGDCGCRFSLEATDTVVRAAAGPEYLYQATCPNCKNPATLTKPDWC